VVTALNYGWGRFPRTPVVEVHFVVLVVKKRDKRWWFLEVDQELSIGCGSSLSIGLPWIDTESLTWMSCSLLSVPYSRWHC
jgi:hypothetical protein